VVQRKSELRLPRLRRITIRGSGVSITNLPSKGQSTQGGERLSAVDRPNIAEKRILLYYTRSHPSRYGRVRERADL